MSGREIGADLTERSLTLAEFKAAGLGPEETIIQLPPIEESDGDGKRRKGRTIGVDRIFDQVVAPNLA